MLAFSAFPGISFGGSAIVWADYNNDGFTDAKAGGLWRNDGGTGFTQVDGLGVGSWGDYNNDGFLDYVDRQSNVLRNNGDGTFSAAIVNGSPSSGPKEASTFFDLEGDGDLDFYIAGYEDEPCGFCPVADNVYEYDSASDTFNLIAQPGGRNGRGLSVLDYNEDLLDDVYVTNYRLQPNNLRENLGTGNFNSYPDVAGSKGATGANGHGGGSAVGDFNNDGLVDIFAQNFAHPGQSESRFLINQGPSGNYGFTDLGPNGVGYVESYLNSAAGDVDNDGDLDVWISAVYGEAARLYVNNLGTGTGSFSVSDATSGYGLGGIGVTTQGAFADIDNDGDLDFMTGEGTLFVNDTSQTTSNNWLRVKLVGDGINVNAHAFGTVVRADLGNGTILSRHVEGSTGRASNQNEQTLHFGLGAHSGPVPLEIIWRDGTVKNVTVDPNQTVTLNYNDIAANEMEIGEVGVINTLTHVPQTVTLDRHFDNPVVFAQSPSYFGTGATVVRVKNVQSDRFDIFLAESSDENGLHNAAETVSYVVLEAGSHTLSDGTGLEVGAIDTAATVGNQINGVWESISFSTSFSQTPVVLSQVQTNAGSDYLQTRHNSTSVSSFNLALEQEEGVLSGHGTESVGYLAIEPGSRVWSGLTFEAGQTSNVVTHNFYDLSFENTYNDPPSLLTSLATYAGTDNSHLRYQNLQGSGVQVKVEEETTFDTETNHSAAEGIAFVAIGGQGTLTARVPEFNVGEVKRITNLTHVPQLILLNHQYANPVVFAQSASTEGTSPVSVRVRNVQSDRFIIQLTEPSDENGLHNAQETVTYVVMEAGTHQMADGTRFEVGSITSDSTVGSQVADQQWNSVAFATTFNSSPAVFTQIQTMSSEGQDYLQTRQTAVTQDGFQTALEQEQAAVTTHPPEEIGYLAMESGQGMWNGIAFEAFATPNSVTHDFFDVAFQGSYSDTPGFLSSMTSYAGTDSAHIRYTNLDGSGVQVKVGEDTTFNTELLHSAAESVAYLAIDGEGALTAIAPQVAIGEVGQVTNLTHVPQTILLERQYSNPVVFAQSASSLGAEPVVVRVNNVQSDRFSIYLAEPSNLNGLHNSGETATYVVFEEGTYELAHGAKLEVGQLSTDSTVGKLVANEWDEIRFSSSFGEAPVVFSQIQTNHGQNYLYTRHLSASPTNVFLALEQEEQFTEQHGSAEKVGYMAIESGAGIWSGLPFEVFNTPAIVTDTFEAHSFVGNYSSSTPRLLSQMATYQDSDNSNVRYDKIGKTEVEFKVSEDTTLDPETSHTVGESVAYLALDGDGILTAAPTIVKPTVNEFEIGEVGAIDTLTHQSQTVLLSRPYINPVVFAQSLSFENSDPSVVRVRNVQSNRFDIFVAESSDLDGIHDDFESASYVVVEAGSYTLADGTRLEVGATDTSATVGGQLDNIWEAIDFDTSFSSTPVVLSQIQTNFGSDFLNTRYFSVSPTSVTLGLEQHEAATTQHVSERVGYLAIESGSGDWNGMNFEAGSVATVVTHQWQKIPFSNVYGTAPSLLTSMTTYSGTDNAHLRYQNAQGGSVELKVEEEMTSDTEMDHVAGEGVAYLAIGGQGTLTARVPEFAVGEVKRITDLTDQPQVVLLDRPYVNPIVFADSASSQGIAPVGVRVSNVQSDRFTIQLTEPSNENGVHGAETITYVVIEAGTHQLADGTRVEVGSVTTNATVGTLANDQWESVDFATTFTSSPVILSQIQTMSVGGEDYLQTRHDGVDKSGFQLALEQEELATGQHAAEEIGYLAIESGRGSWNGIAFEAYTTPTSVTDGWYYRSFAGSYSATTGFLSSLASYVDADRGHVRYKSLDGEGVQLRIGEDTTVDTELDHLAESVAYLAIDGEGPLTAIAAHHEIGEVGRITNLTHNQQTIILERHYTNPVVFAGSATTNGTDPVAVRVTDVQSDRFTIYLAEPSNLNGLHNADETVSYMVLEAGSHQLSNGARLEVGSVTTQATVGILVQNETETVNYSTPFHTTPVVFSQIQTDAGEAYLQTRHLSNSQSHVELALEQEEFITQQHSVPETVGYLALESGTGVWTGLPFEVYNTPAGVTQDWETQRFDASYGSSTPNLLFSLATYVGRTTQKFVTET